MSDNARINLFQRIIDFYTPKCDGFLTGVNRSTLAIHAGFTDENVREYEDSLIYMNQILAERADVCQGDYVLDAGCGVGGSAIWLAKMRGARVIGISIVKRQLELATVFAVEEGVDHLVQFCVGDFTQTSFNGNSFDVVWALESSCYALDKRAFIHEAWRVLKSGGRFIVADGFRNAAQDDPREEALLSSWLSSWEVPGLATPEQFFYFLRDMGFSRVQFEDISKNVMPFSIHLFQQAILDYARERNIDDLSTITYEDLDAIRGARDQLQSLSEKLWLYGIFVGIKSRNS